MERATDERITAHIIIGGALMLVFITVALSLGVWVIGATIEAFTP